MLRRLYAMLIKEFIQTFRDPRMRVVLFVLPVVQTVIFGFAVSLEVKNIPTVVIDRDHTPQSRLFSESLYASGYFVPVPGILHEDQAEDAIDRSRVRLMVVVDQGFSEKRRQPVPVQAIIDGTDSNTAGIILGYLNRFVASQNREAARESGRSSQPAVTLIPRVWFNQDLASPPFYVPAVIANILFIITMLLSAMAIVREKEIGTIEQVMVTPIKKAEFILGKTIPFVIIGYANVTLISIVGWLVFRVPIRGSLLLLALATGLFLMSSLGTGLFISTISGTQQQAKMSAFFVLFIAMLLSGFAFPVDSMPLAVQWLTWINPVRWYMESIRGLYLKGIGLDVLWKQLGMLFLIGMVVLGAAVNRFRKTVA